MCSNEGFSTLLQKCGTKRDLRTCLKLYTQSVELGLNSDGFLGGHFIRAFDLCGSLVEARKHFLRLPERNVFTWSAIISAHASNGLCEQAILLYKHMLHSKAMPDAYTFVAALKACAQSLALAHGMLIHHQIIGSSLELDCHIGNTLVDFYGKNFCVQDAHKVFGRLKETDVVTWNAIISGYAKEKNSQEVLQLVTKMEVEGIKPDNVTFVNVLKACGGRTSCSEGKLVHSWIIERAFNVDAFVWSSLIDMYAKGDGIKDAQKLFDSFSTNDEVTWSTMIAGYVVHGLWQEALLLFAKMQHLGIKPGRVTLFNVLKIMSETSAFEDGRLVHTYVVERACDHDGFVVSSLVDMYSKCSSLIDAHVIFENSRKDDPAAWSAILSGYFQQGLVKDACQLIDTIQEKGPRPHIGVWNVIISGCVRNNEHQLALAYFKQMEVGGVAPDSTTHTALVKACWCSLSLELGKIVHSLVVENGFNKNLFVVNALVDMYSKFGELEEAQRTFSQLPNPDVVTWNSLIEGYAQHQQGEQAILCFQLMEQSGCKPDSVTVLSVLKASAVILALKEGMLIHAIAIAISCESDENVGSSLIDMYCRCGMLDEASKVFEQFKEARAAWNSMISGFAANGMYRWDAYESMTRYSVAPDRVTYLCLLSACSHLGLVHEGCNHFATMSEYWRLKPKAEHYGCMVDLWARVGCLKEAHRVLLTIPSEKCPVMWMSLMHHSQVHGKFDLAKLCLDQLVHILGCQNEAAYSLMATFFGDAQLQGSFDGVREFALDAKWRIPGQSIIEADGKIHTFFVGDRSHEASGDIESKLKKMQLALRCQGFVPHASMFMQRLPLDVDVDNVSSIFAPTDDRGRESSSWFHSQSSVL